MSNLKKYLPKYYNGVLEAVALIVAENVLFDLVGGDTKTVKDNQYVLTADSNMIKEYENILSIIPNLVTESLQFRRARIINRLSTKPPFSLGFLFGKLDEIVGVGKWDAYVDYATQTLYVESSAANQVWFHEIYVTINQIKPANIIFINKPLVVADINVSEEVSYTQSVFHYKLGTSWVLGKKPFRTFEDRGLVKMANIPSIKPKLLNDIAGFAASDISKVRINGSLVITSFTLKSASQNIATIEYEVGMGTNITEITKVELLDSTDVVLTDAAIYVPVLDGALMKHNILIKEGV